MGFLSGVRRSVMYPPEKFCLSHTGMDPSLWVSHQSLTGSQNHISCCCCPYFSPRSWKSGPIVKDTAFLKAECGGIQLELAVSLWTRSCSIWRFYASCQESETKQSIFYPAVNSTNHCNGQHSKMLARSNSGTSVLGVTYNCLNGFKVIDFLDYPDHYKGTFSLNLRSLIFIISFIWEPCLIYDGDPFAYSLIFLLF